MGAQSSQSGRSRQPAGLLACWVALSVTSVALAGALDPLTTVVEKLRQGDASGALALVESFDSELKAVPRVAYLHARLLDRVGRRSEALPILMSIVEAPALPTAIRADAAKRRGQWEASLAPATGAGSGTAVMRSSQDKLDRAEKLLNAGREQAAADLLRATPPRSLRGRWYHVRGLALFRMRGHYDEAARVLALAAAAGGDTQAFDSFHAARALARDDQNIRAITELRKFARRFAQSSFAAEALYLAAWLELRLGREVGFRNMQTFVRSDLVNNAPSFKQQALWALGYYAYTHGRLADAERHLLEAASSAPDEMAQSAASYWAARARLDQGNQTGAVEIWNRLIEHDPFHWYALLARARLSQLNLAPPPPTHAASASVTAITPSPTLPDDVAFYAGIGLFQDATAALQKQETQLRATAPPGHELQTLVTAYLAIDDHARAYHVTIADQAPALMTAWTPATDWIWRTTMATPHRNIVQREAAAHGVDEGYVYAIMRKESAFDPNVVSYADALGLMQLLHATAIKVARALGDPEPSRTDLFRPPINIRLGTALLAQLGQELGPERALSMAGYNAGAHRVHQWLKQVSKPELDRFVEEIPIDQTRNYVRRVHANWARYRYLYEPDHEAVTLNLTLSLTLQ